MAGVTPAATTTTPNTTPTSAAKIPEGEEDEGSCGQSPTRLLSRCMSEALRRSVHPNQPDRDKSAELANQLRR